MNPTIHLNHVFTDDDDDDDKSPLDRQQHAQQVYDGDEALVRQEMFLWVTQSEVVYIWGLVIVML